jgi:uncharacterized tellurite resistance protein B-like protein
MIDRIRAFLLQLTGPNKPVADPDDPRVAAVALLVHVADADGTRTAGETEALSQLVVGTYGLDGAQAEQLIAKATFADRESTDFYRFTRSLSRTLDRDGKREVIAMMWDIAYADSALDEMEGHIVWRISELIGIEQQERVALRQEAAERRRLAL